MKAFKKITFSFFLSCSIVSMGTHQLHAEELDNPTSDELIARGGHGGGGHHGGGRRHGGGGHHGWHGHHGGGGWHGNHGWDHHGGWGHHGWGNYGNPWYWGAGAGLAGAGIGYWAASNWNNHPVYYSDPNYYYYYTTPVVTETQYEIDSSQQSPDVEQNYYQVPVQ